MMHYIRLSKNNYNSESAFTIIELLIVIVIIGILAAIIAVSYIGISQKARNAQTISGVE